MLKSWSGQVAAPDHRVVSSLPLLSKLKAVKRCVGVRVVTRKCSTCQHTKRAEIDRRLAAGEPGNQIARDYDLNPSSLHRHRTNCIGLASSNSIMKEVARGTAAITCLPSKDDLHHA